MHVYSTGHKNHTCYVAPARDERGEPLDGASQWKSEDGEPLQYAVRFRDGRAEVDASLGQWLIRHGYAKRTRLILPAMFKDKRAA